MSESDNFTVQIKEALQDDYGKTHALHVAFNGRHWTVLEFTRTELKKVRDAITKELEK